MFRRSSFISFSLFLLLCFQSFRVSYSDQVNNISFHRWNTPIAPFHDNHLGNRYPQVELSRATTIIQARKPEVEDIARAIANRGVVWGREVMDIVSKPKGMG